MHAVLVSMGTDGDVYPYLGLGTRLRARGHRVTLIANEPYHALAHDLGFDFRPLITSEEAHQLLGDADFWHPLKGALVGARFGVQRIARQYDLIAEVARAPDTVLVANPGVFAARLVRETLDRPMATLLLQPWMIASCFAPPVMPFGLTLPRWAPALLGRFYWRLVDTAGHLLVGRDLQRIRARLGLKPIGGLFRWWMSPDLILGLFPAWYGPPQSDWPAQVRLAGFPLQDGAGNSDLSPQVRAFCQAGEPPIAFTLGTGMMHAADFFRAAAEACRVLGVRGLFLTKYRQQLPEPLPPFVLHLAFAPFLQLFPHCAAVVHHGGVGTVAKALATGTPQLILPLAWDQPDNAIRVKRFGVGDWLPPARRSSSQLRQALAGLLHDKTKERCREVASWFDKRDALETAAIWLEDLESRSGSRR